MKVLLCINSLKDPTYVKTKQVLTYLLRKGFNVYVTEDVMLKINLKNVFLYDGLVKMDLIFVLGGDGTFLDALHQYFDLDVPFIGLNIGRVGYLAEGDMHNYAKVIDSITNGEYIVTSNNLLQIKIMTNPSKTYLAFNDAVIHRGKDFSMLKIEVKVKDDFIDTFYGDGVLIASTLGSSAYNLSARGPLLLNDSHCFVVTPICPQSGIMPSVVAEDAGLITVCPVAKSGFYSLVIDGKKEEIIASGTKISIVKAEKQLKVLKIASGKRCLKHIEKMYNGYVR